MTFVRNLTSFSQDGEYLAYSSPDGCLKIWETVSGSLKQEYTPSSHLSATCSSLCWGPSRGNHHVSKKFKKTQNTAYADILKLRLIAMGTMTGDILLYSFTNADLSTCLTNGHTSTVNDVIWYQDNLYSCSNDQHIIIWDVGSGTIKMKWKANTGPIYSICVIDDINLLTACNSVQWWDVKQKVVIKVFNGHSSEILKMIPIKAKDGQNYFLSTAVGDRIMNAWHLKKGKGAPNSSISSFVLTDEPVDIDIFNKKDEAIKMSTVSQDGSFHFFEFTFNGKLKKPLQPKFSIQVASKASENVKPCSLPILAANISSGLDYCILSYGNFLKPLFERLDITNITKDLFLIRNVTQSSVTVENITKIKQTVKPSNVKLLAPGHMTDVSFSESVSKKRKKKDLDIKELPMEERLKALDLSKTPKETSEDEIAVKSDSMIHLLLQGLQSKDNNMLNTVLLCGDEQVIYNTLERLPIQSIFSLLKVLYERLNKREPRNHPCLKWFTALITIHLSYFMSCPDISEYLLPFEQLFSARKEVFCKMAQAQGVLKILMSQTMSSSSNMTDSASKPLTEYASESSEESDVEIDDSFNSSDEEVAQNSSDSSESESSDSESEMENE